ncbi:ERAD-associated E3 ubiquitin-protein ligase HRD1B [Diplonema papillatum]|nr:ERAD-associated E3 ubiquitin-protein ligase HRD1B [Diplonema papillatum]
MRKFTIYSLVSTGVLGVVVASAFFNHRQFYPSVVALSQNQLFNVLMMNTYVVLVYALFEIVRVIFLGKLRDQEIERVRENVAIFLMEIFMTLTIFGERYGIRAVALFVICVLCKIFHWLAQSRLEFIEQTPAIGTGELRLTLFLFLLILVDCAAGRIFVADMLANGLSVRLLLFEEFMVMAVYAVSSLVRLIIHLVDARRNRRWQGKGAARFYLEIITESLRFIICFSFLYTITAFYGLPFNLLRDSLLSIRRVYRTVCNFLNYRRLALHLDTNFPNASEDDLSNEPICSICFDDLLAGDAKKLACGHIFHRHCLRQWLERQTTCPYCRQTIDVSRGQPHAAEEPPAVQEPATTQDELAEAYRLYAATFDQARTITAPPAAAAAPASAVSSQPSEAGASPVSQPPPSTTHAASPRPAVPAVPLAHALNFPSTALGSPPTLTEIQTYVPSMAEVEVYRNFHCELYKAYSTLYDQLKEKAATSSSVN